jgi:23S rRNA pseudouridine1911/1915/1917 synthase
LEGGAFRWELVVSTGEEGLRIDQALATRGLPRSRSQIKRHIEEGFVLLEGVAVRPSRRVRAGERILYTPPPPEPGEALPEEIPLVVLFEDDAVVVVDKPAGMVVHPSPGHGRGTLVNALLARCGSLSGVGGVLRPGIVHRLDRLTSGVLVASKTDEAHQALAAQFAAHTVERRYLALIAGVLREESGTFDTLHGRHPADRKRFSTRPRRGPGAGARRAVTHYRVLERLEGASLVEARLETGRTHQVRLHFADAGHPVLGDPLYGRPPAHPRAREVAAELGRQALHARVLAFDHPRTGERLRFVTPPPEDMRAAIAKLERAGRGGGGAGR